MSSRMIGGRVSKTFHKALCRFCVENDDITIADIVKVSTLEWFENKTNIPDYIKKAIIAEKSNLTLKEDLRRILFVHNVKRKLNKLSRVEGVPATMIPKVHIPILESFIKLADANEWESEKKALEEILRQANSRSIVEQHKFMQWVGYRK